MEIGLPPRALCGLLLNGLSRVPVAGCNDIGLGDFALWNGTLNGVPYRFAQLF